MPTDDTTIVDNCCTHARLFTENRFEEDAETRLVACRRYDGDEISGDGDNGNTMSLYKTVCGPKAFSRVHSNATLHSVIESSAPTWCLAEESLYGWLRMYQPGRQLSPLIKRQHLEGGNKPLLAEFNAQLDKLEQNYNRYRKNAYNAEYHAGCVEPEEERLGDLIEQVRDLLNDYAEGIFESATDILPQILTGSFEFK